MHTSRYDPLFDSFEQTSLGRAHPNLRVLPIAACLIMLFTASHAGAQGIATDQQLTPITVKGVRAPLDPNLPNSTASVTAEQLREQNLMNPEDALKNLPNLTIRKRYIGDRNSLIAGRSFSTLQAPRGLVLMDGYLLSNFLGRFDAPRWNMIAPEEIARVDVLYGPFSALYTGNSIGTTVAVTLRKPTQFEASARITTTSERFKEYAIDDTFNAYQTSAYLANRLGNKGWFALSVNQQRSTGHPMQYATASADANGNFAPVTGAATPVTGVQYDIDPRGFKRAVLGANSGSLSGSIDTTDQVTAKLRGGIELAPNVQLEGMLSHWVNNATTRNQSFLKDLNGNPVWSGVVSNSGNRFSISPAVFAPSSRDEVHTQLGVTYKTQHKTGWNHSIVLGHYEIGTDRQRNANAPDPVAFSATSSPGGITDRAGTKWNAFEAQATYTPTAGDWTDGKHALTAGYHRNDYTLAQSTLSTNEWRNGSPVAITQFVGGQTRLQALYVQDAWAFAPQWKLTSGLRYEQWEAYDGKQQFFPGPQQLYASRSISASSPKLSLAYEWSADTTVRMSAGRGMRFPTVVELFQGSRTGNSIVTNDPNLQPERSDALEATIEHRADWGQLRASVFEDDIRNTIYSQTNTTVTPNITNVQNVQRVRVRGIELVASFDEFAGITGLNVDGNLALNRSRIVQSNFAASVGKEWVRVPHVCANVAAAYRINPQWQVSGSLNHSGRQYNELDNGDINPQTFGASSSYTMLDVRARYRPIAQLELAFGISNLTNEKAWQLHPYPQRTWMLEARWQL